MASREQQEGGTTQEPDIDAPPEKVTVAVNDKEETVIVPGLTRKGSFLSRGTFNMNLFVVHVLFCHTYVLLILSFSTDIDRCMTVNLKPVHRLEDLLKKKGVDVGTKSGIVFFYDG